MIVLSVKKFKKIHLFCGGEKLKKKKSGFNFNLKQFFGKLLQNFAMFVPPPHFFLFIYQIF